MVKLTNGSTGDKSKLLRLLGGGSNKFHRNVRKYVIYRNYTLTFQKTLSIFIHVSISREWE
jgi:hypothetical protein